MRALLERAIADVLSECNPGLDELLRQMKDRGESKSAVMELVQRRTGSSPLLRNGLGQLIDHAQQGVYRPGAWERDWVIRAFGDDFLRELVPDTSRLVDGVPVFQRPSNHKDVDQCSS